MNTTKTNFIIKKVVIKTEPANTNSLQELYYKAEDIRTAIYNCIASRQKEVYNYIYRNEFEKALSLLQDKEAKYKTKIVKLVNDLKLTVEAINILERGGK